jgi:hypothetical protein
MTVNDRWYRHKPLYREPIRPDRVRGIGDQGFAFIPNRFLRDGFFVSLTPDEQRLYLLLVLAGDRQGLSFYHYDSLSSLLEMPLDDYIEARNGLIKKDLVAHDGTRFQVLSLPHCPVPRTVPSEAASEGGGPDEPERSIDIRRSILAALARD